MWKFLANKVLRNRPAFLFGLVLLTVFMGYMATNIKLSYHFASLLPATDSSFVQYERFKKLFGEDGSVMVIGLADSSIFRIEKFNDWYLLSKKIKKIDGIQNVLSLGDVYDLVRNDSLRRFDFVPLVKSLPQQQSEIDSIRKRLDELPFYDGLVLNKETNATLMAITFKKKDLDSKHRIDIVNEIKKEADAFSRLHNIELHFSGMPYIRTAVMEKVSHELKLFLILAVIMTTIILGAFFRSISSVVISVIVVAIGVLWSIGSIELLNYKITILTALIPPLIMVIGVPNCIFLINKYHSEYAHHGNKVKALARMITTIGVSLFLANITTAIGFGVFVLGLGLFYKSEIAGFLIIDALLLVTFLIRGLATFSRGGMMGGLIAMAILILYSAFFSKRPKILFYSISFVLIASLVGFNVWNYVNKNTEGRLEYRYRSIDYRTGQEKDFSSGRSEILARELLMFTNNPVLGVGPGMGVTLAEQRTGIAAQSHSEYTRLLAEHGLLGVGALMILLFMPVKLIMALPSSHRPIFLALFFLTLFTMFHSAMRLAAPGFFYGLCFIKPSAFTLSKKDVGRN